MYTILLYELIELVQNQHLLFFKISHIYIYTHIHIDQMFINESVQVKLLLVSAIKYAYDGI